jgi:signal recognition particle GTPase
MSSYYEQQAKNMRDQIVSQLKSQNENPVKIEQSIALMKKINESVIKAGFAYEMIDHISLFILKNVSVTSDDDDFRESLMNEFIHSEIMDELAKLAKYLYDQLKTTDISKESYMQYFESIWETIKA